MGGDTGTLLQESNTKLDYSNSNESELRMKKKRHDLPVSVLPAFDWRINIHQKEHIKTTKARKTPT